MVTVTPATCGERFYTKRTRKDSRSPATKMNVPSSNAVGIVVLQITFLTICEFTIEKCSAEEKNVFLNVQPACTSIEVGDPLFLKVKVLNNSDLDIYFESLFGPSSDVIEFEKRSTDGMWKRTRDQSPLAKIPRKRFTIPAHTSLCSYHALMCTKGDEFIFATPGQYHIRIGANASIGRLVSKPIVIDVGAADKVKLDFLADRPWRIFGRMHVGSSSAENERLDPLDFTPLPQGFIRTHLEATQIFVCWQNCKLGTAEYDANWKDFEARLQKFDPIMTEINLLGIASHFYEKQQFDSALRFLDRLPDESYSSRSLRRMTLEKLAATKQRTL